MHMAARGSKFLKRADQRRQSLLVAEDLNAAAFVRELRICSGVQPAGTPISASGTEPSEK